MIYEIGKYILTLSDDKNTIRVESFDYEQPSDNFSVMIALLNEVNRLQERNKELEQNLE